jgi:hypothetical protein
MPVRNEKHGDYVCPYRVVGLNDDEVRGAWGIDSIQALWLAFKAIGSRLAKHSDLRLDGSTDLGFPPPPTG